ncbi:hypothetical protein cypCar_00045991 [Cyprinus carpio]|nr:hypothetical protein cypCar_00045991 [Cyprinus carpio]
MLGYSHQFTSADEKHQEELKSAKTEFIKEDREKMRDPEPCRIKPTEDTQELTELIEEDRKNEELHEVEEKSHVKPGEKPDLKCLQTAVCTEDGESTAAFWKWMRRSITPPALTASSGPDVAVVSSSSVTPEQREHLEKDQKTQRM